MKLLITFVCYILGCYILTNLLLAWAVFWGGSIDCERLTYFFLCWSR